MVLLQVEMNQCRQLHERRCGIHFHAWMEDHRQPNMEDVYAHQTESEAEAVARLSGEEGTDDDSGWDTAVPNSSFGPSAA